MTGLEDRLRSVNGVSDIVVELSDEGLEGIRVRMHEGTDESQILEEIRRILVAYGLKGSTRKKSGGPASPVPPLELGEDVASTPPVDPDGSLVSSDTDPGPLTESDTEPTPPASTEPNELPHPVIIPAGDQLTVRLHSESRVVEATSDATPLGAADAMVRALCEWNGATFPSRIAVDRLEVDGVDLVILVARKGAHAVVAASAIQPSLAVALRDAGNEIVEQITHI